MPNSTQLRACIQMQNILWKMPSQEHYSIICTDDTLPYWSYHGEPLCTLVGRVPFLARPHLSLFCSLQLSVTQQPISMQLNTDDDCLRILNSSTYPVTDRSFTAFLLAPGERHNGSFMTQTEAELIWRWLNVAKERNDSRQGTQVAR